jgi:hypothetical protein
MAKNAADSAALWAQRTAAATPQYISGVQAVTVSPGQKASQKAAFWASQTQAAQAKFAAATGAITLGDWQAGAINKGAPRIASGVAAAQPKMQTFLTSLIQYEQSALAQLPPRGDAMQNQQRMVAWNNLMLKFKKPAGS